MVQPVLALATATGSDSRGCLFYFQHEFVSVDHAGILQQLVQRTMDAVRHQDSQNYKRLQKMLMGGKGRGEEDETPEDGETERVK